MVSPLISPVRLKNDKILVLDETKIPFCEEYIEVSNLEEALLVLEEMKTRSLGQVLLFFYSCQLWAESISFQEIAQEFKQRRPTFDFLMLGEILRAETSKCIDVKEVVSRFVYGFDQARRGRARRLAGILPNPANILTICNVNGELIYLYEELKNIGKEVFFVVCETRPYLQGTRLTFWELRKNNIPCGLICDNQAASLMKEGKVNCVVTGADRATTKGDIANKIGTYSLARLAKYFNIPFYPLTQYLRDIDIESIDIEERQPEEAFMYLNGDFADTEAVYPSFDITKSEFITKCLGLYG